MFQFFEPSQASGTSCSLRPDLDILYILNATVIVIVRGFNIHRNVICIKLPVLIQMYCLKNIHVSLCAPVCISVMPIKCAVTCPEVLV